MMALSKWIRIYYTKITGSIAFYPAIIATGFLLLSWIMLEIDFSQWGKEFKSGLSWLSLKDANTARSITSTIAGAVISLTVFSFSMVMIVLNQAASQMSNRVLTSMIENRFQQITLGCYIGTIVYALFLLSTIRDISTGMYVPALSIYLLILLTVVDIFLFIYFLDYATQMVKFEKVIDRVRKQTYHTMVSRYDEISEENVVWDHLPYIEIRAEESNYFQRFDEKALLDIACANDLYLCFLHKQATFLVTGTIFIRVYSKNTIDKKCLQQILSAIDFFEGQPIDINPEYGFHQLAEVAIKALSPGINDPGTAIISLHALFAILSYKLSHGVKSIRKDVQNVPRIYLPSSSFKDLFERCVLPIWNYGKNDSYVQDTLLDMIAQLKTADHKNLYSALFDELLGTIEKQKLNLGRTVY